MIEPIKVMMDEQTKVALKQLEGALADLLAPLRKLDEGGGTSDGMDVQQITGEIRKLSNFLEDALNDVKRKLSDVCDNQEDLFRKVAELSAKQAAASVAIVARPQESSVPDKKVPAKKTPPDKKLLAKKKLAKTTAPVKPAAKQSKTAKKKNVQFSATSPVVKNVKKSR